MAGNAIASMFGKVLLQGRASMQSLREGASMLLSNTRKIGMDTKISSLAQKQGLGAFAGNSAARMTSSLGSSLSGGLAREAGAPVLASGTGGISNLGSTLNLRHSTQRITNAQSASLLGGRTGVSYASSPLNLATMPNNRARMMRGDIFGGYSRVPRLGDALTSGQRFGLTAAGIGGAYAVGKARGRRTRY